MLKQVIDEKIKQYQVLKKYFERLYLIEPHDLSNDPKILLINNESIRSLINNESITCLINIAINDLETIKFLYLHELKDKESIKND